MRPEEANRQLAAEILERHAHRRIGRQHLYRPGTFFRCEKFCTVGLLAHEMLNIPGQALYSSAVYNTLAERLNLPLDYIYRMERTNDNMPPRATFGQVLAQLRQEKILP